MPRIAELLEICFFAIANVVTLFSMLVRCNVTEIKLGEVNDHLNLMKMKSSEKPDVVVMVLS